MKDIDPPAGPGEIRRAAIETVARYLDGLSESAELDDLWEHHPMLLEWEAKRAGDLAWEIAVDLRELLRTMAPKPPAVPPDPDGTVAAVLLQSHNADAPGDLG